MKYSLNTAYGLILMSLFVTSCTPKQKEEVHGKVQEERKYKLDRVGPADAVQAYADGLEQLTPRERVFIYYLYQAAIAGRDIAIDQHHRDALEVRHLFEQVYQYQAGIDPAVAQ
jgi:dipeptidyl-peptidase-3